MIVHVHTLSAACTSALALMSFVTISSWPRIVAIMRAVEPSCLKNKVAHVHQHHNRKVGKGNTCYTTKHEWMGLSHYEWQKRVISEIECTRVNNGYSDDRYNRTR